MAKPASTPRRRKKGPPTRCASSSTANGGRSKCSGLRAKNCARAWPITKSIPCLPPSCRPQGQLARHLRSRVGPRHHALRGRGERPRSRTPGVCRGAVGGWLKRWQGDDRPAPGRQMTFLAALGLHRLCYVVTGLRALPATKNWSAWRWHFCRICLAANIGISLAGVR
jgi:hypothetical protein